MANLYLLPAITKLFKKKNVSLLKVDPTIHSHDIQHWIIPNDLMGDIS